MIIIIPNDNDNNVITENHRNLLQWDGGKKHAGCKQADSLAKWATTWKVESGSCYVNCDGCLTDSYS